MSTIKPATHATHWHFQYWTTPDTIFRVSITAGSKEIARQIVIGRYAPIFVRILNG